MKLKFISAALLSVLMMSSCSNVRIKEHPEWEQYFQSASVKGSFEIYDNNKEIAHYYNKELCSEALIPANTFDIFLALTALESVVAKDEQKIIYWDGHHYEQEEWNKDLTLVEAFKLNATPHMFSLAKEIGKADLYRHLFATQYGNMEIGENSLEEEEEVPFWMNGSLLISPDELVGFMKRLYHTELPQFNERSHRIVRGMLFQEEGETYRLYYKYGVDETTVPSRAWIAGIVESFQTRRHVKTRQMEAIPHPHFFVLTLQSDNEQQDLAEVTNELMWKMLNINGIGDGVGFEKL